MFHIDTTHRYGDNFKILTYLVLRLLVIRDVYHLHFKALDPVVKSLVTLVVL